MKPCNSLFTDSPSADDGFGQLRQDCKQKRGRKICSVLGRKTSLRGKVRVKDKFGVPGLRCGRHGGRRGRSKCSVVNNKTNSEGRVSLKDDAGEPGPRCSLVHHR